MNKIKEKKSSEKIRLDQLLVEQGFFESKQKSQAFIMQGNVLVNDQPIVKPGTKVKVDVEIRIRGEVSPYVSRGALKLLKALEVFQVNVQGFTCLDIGASTGGFTQVLLMNQAQKVYAVDVGHNQMDWKIRNNPKVVVIENENARYLDSEKIPEKVDLIVMDVSFISVLKIIPQLLKNFCKTGTQWIILIKPQFEAGPEHVEKGGIVKKEDVREAVVKEVLKSIKEIGLIEKGLIESPIKGTKGNVEFLAYFI